MSWFYHHHFTVQWPEFAISELLFQIPFFANCRPGLFLCANFVIPYHFFCNFFKKNSWIFLQTLEVVFQDPFFQIFQIVVPDLLLQIFEIVVPDHLFCKLSKIPLILKLKIDWFLNYFLLKRCQCSNGCVIGKRSKWKILQHFSSCWPLYADETIRNDNGEICENCFSSPSTSLDVLCSTWVVVQGSLEGPLSACMIIYIPPKTI